MIDRLIDKVPSTIDRGNMESQLELWSANRRSKAMNTIGTF